MKIIAHRGASGYEPENTLRAVKTALAMKADAIEIDLHRVEDQLMVLHDRWLGKTTNGQGRIDKVSFEYIRSLDAGLGEKVPTLWELLSVIDGQCEVNIELKSDHVEAILLPLLQKALTDLHFSSDQILLSSFNHPLLHRLHQLAPEWRLGALTAGKPLKLARFAQDLQAFSLNLDIDFTDQELIVDAHARGLQVYVYTLDHPEDIEMVFGWGVDGIFTNYPDKAREQLDYLNRR